MRRAAGFTLLELLLVISLMALFYGLFLGGFSNALPMEIRTASRVVAAELDYASQRAITTGALHRWTVDLEQQAFRLERLEVRLPPPQEDATHAELLDLAPPRGEREFVPLEQKQGEWRVLDESGVFFESVQIADQVVTSGVIGVLFAADGGADPAAVVLQDGAGRRTALRVIAFTGEIVVEELEDAT
jgi:prepilin-type N-terminal cleavage/methylation domain-containing protein